MNAFVTECTERVDALALIEANKPIFSFENIGKVTPTYHEKADHKPRKLFPFAEKSIICSMGHFKYVRSQVEPLIEYLGLEYKKNLISRFTQIFNEFDFYKAYGDLATIVKPVNKVINSCKFDDKKLLHNDIKRREFADVVATANRHHFDNLGKQAVRKELDFNEAIALIYDFLVEVCAVHGIRAPYNNKGKTPLTAEKCESGVLRLMDGKYWEKKFDTVAKRTNEHVAIALGKVRKNYSPYVSHKALADNRRQQEENQKYLEMMDVVEKETGKTRKLSDVAKLTNSNPENRRNEFMVISAGEEKRAIESGKIPLFLTITAPSKYHKNSNKYNLSSPKSTHEMLCKNWTKIRAKCARENIDYVGIRVVEPHADATPHWHVLVYVAPHDEELFTEICLHYTTQEDVDELHVSWAKHLNAVKNGKSKSYRKSWHAPRFTADKIDLEKGSATGYIAKYISKNINGAKMDGQLDDEAEIAINESAQRVVAWASLWGIRQFQCFGVESITIRRQLRQVKTPFKDETLEAVRLAADGGDWAHYSDKIRGLDLKLAYEDTEELNDYNEPLIRVNGLVFNGLALVTKLLAFELKKRSLSLPWSPVNNCTHQTEMAADINWALSNKIENNLRKMGFDDGSLGFLLSGNAVFLKGQKFEILNGQLTTGYGH